MLDFTEVIFDKSEEIKFYNITYRGYLGLWRGYVFDVKPFTLTVHKLNEDDLEKFENDEHTQSFASSLDCIDRYNTQLYMRQECGKDPCDIYEIVSGDRIHNGGNWVDNYKRNLDKKYYREAKESFIVKARQLQRIKKIDDVIQ